VTHYSRQEAAERAGTSLEDLREASEGAGARFTEIGPVELKGVAGAMHLHAAHRE
jgi:hypothetical protein